ncbi:MAG TPA: glycosyltransferase family 4 protein, partial [Phormidium sp.]
FFLSLIPYIHIERPDVLFFSDFVLGTMLWHWRRLNKLSYKLLFSNGAPNGPPFSRMDHVQHLTPTHYQMALDAGEPATKHSLIPYGIQINQEYTSLTQLERGVLRRKLNLPVDRPLILSVGAINKSHKRMDFLIQELARLPEPRPYLLLLGQIDAESQEIIQFGNQLLGTNYFQAKTVTFAEISNYYRIADLFVLASLNEGFGRVFLEAMMYGLPCLAHDYQITRFVLKDHGFFANFAIPGGLAVLIQQVLAQSQKDAKYYRHQSVYERFSWEKLRPAYIEMLHLCASEDIY